MRRRIAVITSRFPMRQFESFLHDEIQELSSVYDVRTIPALRPMISLRILRQAIGELLRDPWTVARLFFRVTTAPRRWQVRFRNAAIFPKALAVANDLRELGSEHVHAYWLSTPATVAYIAAAVNRIPWSATGHRYDIVDYNIRTVGAPHGGFLGEAQFIRTISERGRRQVLLAVHGPEVHTVHLGLRIGALAANDKPVPRPVRVVCVASFDPVKGHEVLFRALRFVKSTGMAVTCTLAGDGPERSRLERLVKDLEIDDIVQFAGSVPHAELLAQFAAGMYDIAVLTSLNEGWECSEGIPASLMELMAAGIPCVATASGSVDELITPDNGVLVAAGDHVAVAKAIRLLARDEALYARLRSAARKTIVRSFNVVQTAHMVGDLIFDSELDICAQE